MLSVTEWNRVTDFAEKPREPESDPRPAGVALASMGIYVFNARLLEKLLIADAADRHVRARLRQEHHSRGDRQAAGVRLPVHRREDARAELLA